MRPLARAPKVRATLRTHHFAALLVVLGACTPKKPPAISCTTPEPRIGSVEAYAIDERGVRTMPYRFSSAEQRSARLHVVDKAHLWAPDEEPIPTIKDVLFLEAADWKSVSVTYLERGDDGRWQSRADHLTCTEVGSPPR